MKNGRKTIAIGLLGYRKDAVGGFGEGRWNCHRRTIGLVQQNELGIDEFHLVVTKPNASKIKDEVTGAEITAKEFTDLIVGDIMQVAPQIKVIVDHVELEDKIGAWRFEEVYSKFYDYSQQECFHREDAEYLIHISLGSHVEQICLFLLAETHHLPGKLVQTYATEGHAVSKSSDNKGKCSVIDLDLEQYDEIAKRFDERRKRDANILKQGISTRNQAFNALIDEIEQVAVNSRDSILLTGPTGAGKTLLAEKIYELRKSKGLVNGRFVKVNCASLTGDTVQSAIFGHTRGAFTGATAPRAGYLREADGGLLFLDEVGTLPIDTQAMLLKAIEEHSFRPMGGDKDEKSNFQLICGTNENLAMAVRDGRFRRDLLERINLWSFRLPGLADRREDIEPNLDFEIEKFIGETKRHISFNREARERFMRYAIDPNNAWEGNFRELNAMVRRMGTLAINGRITVPDVEREIARISASRMGTSEVGREVDLQKLLGDGFETTYDPFDLVQLSYVVEVCRSSRSLADASRKLFVVSLAHKKSLNNSDRLSKYLAKFGLDFQGLVGDATA